MKVFRREFGLVVLGCVEEGRGAAASGSFRPYQRTISDKQLAENIHDE